MAAPTNTQFAVAIHVLTLLAGHRDSATSSDEMALSVGSNPVYLRRVLGRLREHGLVDSRPGPRGGWHLVREPETITLGDTWRAIQERAPIFGLHVTVPECPVGRSITSTLSELDERLTRTVEEELDRTTIAQIIPDPATLGALTAPAAPAART